MTDDISVGATPIAQTSVPENKTTSDSVPSTQEQKPQNTSPDDFDESIIPESSRDNFRKFRESQKAKVSDYEKKLNEETRKRMEYESRWNDYESRQRAAQNQPANIGPKPDYRNYSSVEEYTEAVEKWKEAEAINRYKTTQAQEQQQQKQRQEVALIQNKARSASAKYADFAQVVQPISAIADQIPSLVQFIKEFDNGMDVLYHLGKNPATLEALSKLQPFAAGQELLRIQAAMSAPTSKAITKAPEPMSPVNSGGDGSVKSILELVKKDDVSDYVAMEHRKELRKRKGTE
jgi:hypothetical protein